MEALASGGEPSQRRIRFELAFEIVLAANTTIFGIVDEISVSFLSLRLAFELCFEAVVGVAKARRVGAGRVQDVFVLALFDRRNWRSRSCGCGCGGRRRRGGWRRRSKS